MHSAYDRKSFFTSYALPNQRSSLRTTLYLGVRLKGVFRPRRPLNTTTPAQKHHVRQLVAYLQSEELSPEQKSKPLEPIVDDKMPSDRMLSLGDASFGGVVFRQSCGICHKTEGTGPAPSLIRNGYSRYQIAKKVRGLDEKGLNGLRMPLFSKDRLSDRQLLNVVAYVYQL